MNIERMSGALQYPVFLLVWSFGAVLIFANLRPADAALLRYQPLTIEPLDTIPELTADLGGNLEAALEMSEVLSGTWQPAQRAAVEPAEPAESAVAASPLAVDRPIAARISEPAVRVTASSSPGETDYVEPHVIEKATPISQTPSAEDVPSAQLFSKSNRDNDQDVIASRIPVSRAPPIDAARPAADVVGIKRRSRAAIRSGRLDHAWQLLMTHVADGAQDTEYLGLLAVAALGLDRIGEASIVYEKLVLMEADNARWWAGLAHCQERAGLDAAPGYQRVASLAGEGTTLQTLALERLAVLSAGAFPPDRVAAAAGGGDPGAGIGKAG